MTTKSADVQPETTCGHCMQGRQNEYLGYDCLCANHGHTDTTLSLLLHSDP